MFVVVLTERFQTEVQILQCFDRWSLWASSGSQSGDIARRAGRLQTADGYRGSCEVADGKGTHRRASHGRQKRRTVRADLQASRPPERPGVRLCLALCGKLLYREGRGMARCDLRRSRHWCREERKSLRRRFSKAIGTDAGLRHRRSSVRFNASGECMHGWRLAGRIWVVC